MLNSIVIRHELSIRDIPDLLNYIRKRVVEPRLHALEELQLTTNNEKGVLKFSLRKPWDLTVEVKVDRCSVEITCSPRSTMAKYYIDQLLNSIVESVKDFNGVRGKGTLYLLFTKDMKFKKFKIASLKERIVSKLFSGTLTYLVISFMIIAILVLIFGGYAPIILILLHLTLLFFSDNLLLKISEWRLTSRSKNVHIVEIKTDKHYYPIMLSKILSKIGDVKRDIYNNTLKVGKELNEEVILNVLKTYGVAVESLDVRVRQINVYDIVSEVSKGYKISPPKVGIINTVIPNAAAVGVHPGKSSILVTSGLLAVLSEEEIKGVIAHELSHVKNMDPLVLSSIVITEYILRVYVVYPRFASIFESIPILALFYVVFVLLSILMLAKCIEARADLDASITIGSPKPLASALKKLGWKRLISEMRNRGLAWFRIDPHPPLYFRVERLSRLGNGMLKVKHTFISSVKECIVEMVKALTI